MSGSRPKPGAAGAGRDAEDNGIAALIDMMMRDAQASLDDIAEPTAADLAAMDEIDDLGDVEPARDESVELAPALALLAEAEEPEVLSLETLDDVEEAEATGDEMEDVEGLLEEAESLIEDYIDAELDDDELDDEGYDLDDDDIDSYRDLYGDDDTIVPSFREGEFAEEEDGDTDYYNELR
ncbi:MAG: hypothetical protein OXG23_02495 [Chloroflexi bacterium]|nr:hypothetical protein [Chloroflexota bacterium]